MYYTKVDQKTDKNKLNYLFVDNLELINNIDVDIPMNEIIQKYEICSYL